MDGTELPAVKTLTGLPPPCGTSEMLRIFTPIVAQSSVEASLTIMFTLPSCVPPPPEPRLALELEPHATEKSGIAANASPRKIRDNLEFIFVSCEDSKVSTRLNRPKPDIIAAGPEYRAKIPASTLQNTEAGKELRWTGTEVMVRRYYSGKMRTATVCCRRTFLPVPRETMRTAVLAGYSDCGQFNILSFRAKRGISLSDSRGAESKRDSSLRSE